MSDKGCIAATCAQVTAHVPKQLDTCLHICMSCAVVRLVPLFMF